MKTKVKKKKVEEEWISWILQLFSLAGAGPGWLQTRTAETSTAWKVSAIDSGQGVLEFLDRGYL